MGSTPRYNLQKFLSRQNGWADGMNSNIDIIDANLGGAGSPNFADAEVVEGGATGWTLAYLPNPVKSLQLFVEVPSFGAVLLMNGPDYTIEGIRITTTRPY